MKRIAMILCTLLATACANQPTTETHFEGPTCHIIGKVHKRPDSKRLLLYTGIEGNVAQSSTPTVEIEIRNGRFECDFPIKQTDYCELVFAEELEQGYWMSIDFVAEPNDTIRMELYPMSRYGENKIEGAAATTEYQAYKQQLRQLQEATNKVRDELTKQNRYNTAEYTALIEKIENEADEKRREALIEQLQSMSEEEEYTPEAIALRKHGKAEYKAALLSIVEGEPSVARLAMLARQMIYRLPDQEFIDVLDEIYAIVMPNHEMTQFCRRQIDGLSLQVGYHYVDFEAPDLEGHMHRLSDLVEGAKVAVIDLWASWCGPCRRASMEMIPIYEKYKDQGFKVVAIARESGSTDALKAAIEKDGYPWPQLVELDDRANIWSQYGCVNGAGRRILINHDGEILAFDPTIEELTAAIERALSRSKAE